MSRRSNGEGNIRQRSDGRWEGRLSIAGKRRSVFGRSRKDVADQLALIRSDAMLGLTAAPSSQTLESYLKEWRERADHLRPTTAYLYDLLIRVHIKPCIGTVKLKNLKALQLQECYRRIEGARTKEQVHRLLHKALGDAVRLGLVPHNPTNALSIAVARPKKRKLWTLEQVQAFMATCRRYESVYDALWLFMLGTGCRIGEALGLHEDNVNWQTKTATIEASIVRIGTERRRTDPKTEAGIRTLALPGFVLEALISRRVHLVDGYFFRTRDGNVPWTSDLQKRLKEACVRAGLPEITSHDFRRLHATLAIANGVDVKTVQRRLGHASLALTLSVYAQVMAQGDAKAAEALDNMLTD